MMHNGSRLSGNNLDVWSLFDAAATAAPERTALLFRDESISYRELRAQALALCEYLPKERGIGHRDRVALMLSNSPFMVALYLALAALGATAIPINTRLSAREIEDLLAESKPGLLVLDDAHAGAFAVDASTTMLSSTLARIADTGAATPGEGRYQYVAPAASDSCIIFYTSGTTGRPKGVIRTQQNVACTILTAIWMQDFWYDTVLLAPLPLFHISGWETKLLGCLVAGGSAVLAERFDPETVLTMIERHRVTHVFLVPTMTHDIVRSGALGTRELRSLRYWQSGTAPLPKALRDEVVRTLPHLQFRISYGTTEAGIISFLGHHDGSMPAGCVGRVIPSVHVRIVDDDGRDVPTGEAGEIWCASPAATPGFFTAEGADPTPAFNAWNWLATGDLGSLDRDGFLFVSGRKKDVIISGGENIVATEVEAALKGHPAIADAAVIGIPDARWGESVMAFVVPAPGASITAEEIDRHCRAQLAGYKCPRRVEFLAALPRTPVGKIAKPVLRELAARASAAASGGS